MSYSMLWWLWCLVFSTLTIRISFVSGAVANETSLTTPDGLTSDRITTQFPEAEASTSSSIPTISNAPISIEILRIYVPLEAKGAEVKLIWGKQLNDLPSSNLIYGVHYGINEGDLRVPKLTTNETSVLVQGLEFCTKYNFAVSVVNNNGNKINPNNIRSIVTQIDKMAAPLDLQVEYVPQEDPCLLIKWSASCSKIVDPIDYIISAFEKRSSRYVIVSLPRSKRVDFVYNFKVNYNTKFDIKVSTNFPNSTTTDTVTYKVPDFLQPYKVKIAANPDGAFMIYWSEPYVPYHVGGYYYQVNVYRGARISDDYERYYVTRPVIIYKGNGSVYTFNVGTVSLDTQYRSRFTAPIVANLNGETREIDEEDDPVLG